MAGKRQAPTHVLVEYYVPPDVKIKKKLGGGVLKESVTREQPSGKVLHYALAYINANIYAGDSGRVIGYDNSHGYSHKHYYGSITAHPFSTYEELYDAFQNEWMDIAMQYVNRSK